VLILVLVLLALFAPLIATHDQFALDRRAWPVGPGATHYVGTGELGRDIFSRVVYGVHHQLTEGRVHLPSHGHSVGTLVGLTSACFRGATVHPRCTGESDRPPASSSAS
jgi:peptide/nickel transport system permease protein